MSIADEIRAREEEGRLALVVPRLRGMPHPRLIYAAPMLAQVLNGPWDNPGTEYRIGELHADLDHFSSGGLITVASGKAAHAFMKHLDEFIDEVWEIRSRDPKPSLRVFGRFAMQDVFVATHVCNRARLGYPKSREWRDEFERCKAEWRKLFPSYEPIRGETINAYISDNVVDARRL